MSQQKQSKGGTIWTEGSLYLVTEVISDKPNPLGLGKIGIELGKTASIDVGHKQLVRRVYSAVFEADILFEGKKLGHQPSISEWFAELVKPGQQITTTPTGAKSYRLAYCGISNKFSLKNSLGITEALSKTVNTPFIDYFGSDPVPNVSLFGNSAIRFESFGGDEDPMAAVFYDKAAGITEVVSTQNRANIFKAFHRSN